MKKRAIKKLSLNKKTIATLKTDALGRVKGGCDCNCTCECCCPPTNDPSCPVTCGLTCGFTCFDTCPMPCGVGSIPGQRACFDDPLGY